MRNRSAFGQRGRLFVIITALIVMLLGWTSIQRIANSLIGETQEQLDNDNYARRVALRYYVFDYNEGSVPKMLFGNGQPASGSDYVKDMLVANEMGAYWSDIGLIGDWFLFGIIPIISILLMAFKVFKYPFPMYLKYLFASFLIVPTIHSFSESNVRAFYFSIIIYLVCLNEQKLYSNTTN